MLRRASPSGFLPNIETSSDRSRECFDTSCSRVADGSRQTGGPFLLRNGVGTLRSAAESRFSFTGSFLDDGRTKGSSSSSSEAVTRLWTNKRVCRHHLRPVLVCELDMLYFALSVRKLHVFLGEETAHAILAGMQDSSNPKQDVPLWSIQLEKSASQKLDM